MKELSKDRVRTVVLSVVMLTSMVIIVDPVPANTGTTTRVSVSSTGTEGNDWSGRGTISSDGKLVAFGSAASNLVDGDGNASSDIFVHSRDTGETRRVSISTAGAEGNQGAGAGSAALSSNGRYVVFDSWSTNLVPNDWNERSDVFLRDLAEGTTVRVSVDSAAGEANGRSLAPAITSDGHFVAFVSNANNLVSGDLMKCVSKPGDCDDVFIKDIKTGAVTLASIDPDGKQVSATLWTPSISGDGSAVAFAASVAWRRPLYVRDLAKATTEYVAEYSRSWAGINLSADGRYVVFTAEEPLVSEDLNGVDDVYVYDRANQRFELISVSSAGIAGDSHSRGGSISSNGRFVAFTSYATTFAGDTNGYPDVFVRDRVDKRTERVSVSSSGQQGNEQSWVLSHPDVSADGKQIVFESEASNLVEGDTDIAWDVFVRDRAVSSTPSKIMLGIGDSVAAGHGLGKADGYPNNWYAYPARLASKLGLEWEAHNYAITGACAATRGKDGADPDTPETWKGEAKCQTSVLSDELSQPLPSSPDLITLTVGGNDILFAQCFEALILGKQDDPEHDPCAPATLARHLKALGNNLDTLLSRLKQMYGSTEVVLTLYYNPLPEPPVTDEEICPAFEDLHFLRNPKSYGAQLALGQKDAIKQQVKSLQTEYYLRAELIRSQLNDTISEAAERAGSRVAPLFFSGHDMCRSLMGGAESDTWVHGPSLNWSITWEAPLGLDGGSRSGYVTLPNACPDQTWDPDPQFDSGPWSYAGFSGTYFYTLHINCSPHPTSNGQEAIAEAISNVL